MDKKNFLFVLPWLPYPLKTGGHQAIFNGIDAVNGYADNIVITYIEDEDNAQIFEKKQLLALFNGKITIEPYIRRKPKIQEHTNTGVIFEICRILRSFRRIVKGYIKNVLKADKCVPINQDNKPYLNWVTELYPKDSAYVSFILDLIEKYDIKLVQCEMIRNASLVYSLPYTVKKVFVHHELSNIVKGLRLINMPGNDVEKNSYLNFYRTNEVGVLNQYDAVITLSETDCEKLVSQGVTSLVYPSIAIVNTHSDDTMLASKYSRILSFIGTEDHSPNYTGIMWFLQNCWEKMLKVNNSYELQIIGNWSDNTKANITSCYRNVRFHGFVENLSDAIRDTIMIVPILVGSGIRMKILEAASIGVPVVTTSIGVEGLPLKNGEHCFISDVPDDFIDSILKLDDPDLRKMFIRNSNAIIKKNYSFEVLRSNRLQLYNKLLA